MNKNELRKKILGKRNNISSTEKKINDNSIFQNFVGYEQAYPAQCYLVYAGYKSEADTYEIMEYLFSQNKMVFVPKVTDSKQGKMDFYQIHSTKELKPGFCGIPEPEANIKNIFNNNCYDRDNSFSEWRVPVRMLLPGAVFDLSGGRIGYGGGYYDRYLAKQSETIEKVALCYDLQVLKGDFIETEKTDIKVNSIITDVGIYTI